MLEELVNNKNVVYKVNLNRDKYQSCWRLRDINKDKNFTQELSNNKNIISFASLSLYLQKISAKKRSDNSKYYKLKFNNLFNDIFPFERNPNMNFICYNNDKENKFEINTNRKVIIPEDINDKFEEYKNKIINNDIPEMILYKYKYDEILFKELNEDTKEETYFILDILKYKYNYSQNDVFITCIDSLITKFKKDLLDIYYIIKNFSDIFKEVFKVNEVINILTLYDAKYIQFKLKQKKIIQLYGQVLKRDSKIDVSYINNAQNDLDLELSLSYIAFIIIIINNKTKNKICEELINLNINLNNKRLFQTILEDGCDKISEKFCLSPEDVVYNLKVLKNEISGDLKEPNNDCQLIDVCLNKVNELSQRNRKYHPIQLLQKAINYNIIALSCHPYISKIIFNCYFQTLTLSTYPTDKGNKILNASHPSYRCKRIEKCPIELFMNNVKKNENNFSELYLDIENCEKEGLIKVKYEIDIENKIIDDLVSLLNNAINGSIDKKKYKNKFDNFKDSNSSESEENEEMKAKMEYEKKIMARKIIVKNMIIEKEFTQKYFINYIKKELYEVSERLLIEKMSEQFHLIIKRNYIKNEQSRSEDTFYYSIFFINLNTFCCVVIDNNKKIKFHNIFKSFFVNHKCKNDLELNRKVNEIDELNREITRHKPKFIILGVNNVGSYQLIEYLLKEGYEEELIFTDYLSLLKKPKQCGNMNEEEYYYNIALDQFKFTINPLEFIIENYNFKYEQNFILNIKLDKFEEAVNDIPLLNYCLETQIRTVMNNSKFKYNKDHNRLDNYYCFMNGLGPITCKIIDEKKDLKNNIKKNYEEFLNRGNNMDIDSELYNDQTSIYIIKKEEKFEKMLNSFSKIKKNNIYNVIVNDVDSYNKVVNCILFYNQNILQCKLPFSNIDDNIYDKSKYFNKFRIILCKIKEIIITESNYEIQLTNKIEDLNYYIDLNDLKEKSNLFNRIIKFEINEEKDNILLEIYKLKNIINININKIDKFLIKIKEEKNCRNISLNDLKKEYVEYDDYCRFCFRPSFMGINHLFLTFSLCETITLNYDISIDEDKKYILKGNKYESLSDITNNFVNHILKKINEFKQSKYFKSPTQMKSILNSIFSDINNGTNEYNNDDFIDDIIMCFMEDSPNYGILFTKTKDSNYTMDYIEFIPDGFSFHNILFENLSLLIDYYIENNEKDFYKELICNQIISNVHSKMEEIDIEYMEFVKDLDWSKNNINENFNKFDKNNNYSQKNKFLGKKTKDLDFNGWSNNMNINENNQKKQNNDSNNGNNGLYSWGDNKNNGFKRNKIDSNNNIWENNNIKKEINDKWGNNKNTVQNEIESWGNNNNNLVENNNGNLDNNNNKVQNEIESWGNNNNRVENNIGDWGNNNNIAQNETESCGNKNISGQNVNDIWVNNNNINQEDNDNWGSGNDNSWAENNNHDKNKKNEEFDINIISSQKISKNYSDRISEIKMNSNTNDNSGNYNNKTKFDNDKSKENKKNYINKSVSSIFSGWDYSANKEKKNNEQEQKEENNNWNIGNNKDSNNRNEELGDFKEQIKNNNQENKDINNWIDSKKMKNENDENCFWPIKPFEENVLDNNTSNKDNNINNKKSDNNEGKTFNISNNNFIIEHKVESKKNHSNKCHQNKKSNSNNFYNDRNNKELKKNNYTLNNNYHNNNNNYNSNNNKKQWRDELKIDIKEDDLKEDDGQVINFEGQDFFGSFNIYNDKINQQNKNENNEQNKGEKKDNL